MSATSTTSSEGLESLWAYSIVYPGANQATPGRYRIRVTKISAEDVGRIQVNENMLPELEDLGINPSDLQVFSVQGYVDQWSSSGWIHALDWIGDPDDSIFEIEEELNIMFKSFITAIPIAEMEPEDMPPSSFFPKSSRVPRKKGKVKTNDKKGDEPDFEWI
tara:strand:+ start:1558 stop:2043 length:486 start_codon:yes stop_codon:yes gene_type:complete